MRILSSMLVASLAMTISPAIAQTFTGTLGGGPGKLIVTGHTGTLMVTAPHCAGDLDRATVERSGNVFTLSKQTDDGQGMCHVRITVSGDKIVISRENMACSAYHGGSCDFDTFLPMH